MSSQSTKKRKRDNDQAAQPKKKVAKETKPSLARVSSVLTAESCPPIIAGASGIQIPREVSFDSYERQKQPRSKTSKSGSTDELLLQSRRHPTLDLTGREERGEGGKEPYLRHYIGILDEETGQLQCVEAKRMFIRGALRAKEQDDESAEHKKTAFESRTLLSETFGTKKAKKALEASVMNAISSRKNAIENQRPEMDRSELAMLASVGKATMDMATREELQAVVDEAKPAPKPNMDAEVVQEVYDPEAIIGADILGLVPVREWQETARHGGSIQVPSRFVANRVNALAINDNAVTQLRVLRYFVFVLLFYLRTKPGRQKGTRQVAPRDKLREFLSPAPEAVVENIRRKFSDGGEMRKFHIDLLMTHCCAFAFIVDNFEVDTQNLRDDLRLDQNAINQFFREIGGRVKPTSKKDDGSAKHIARLRLPLEFPRQRVIANKRR